MEIHTPCSAEGCKERIILSFDPQYIVAHTQALAHFGWLTLDNDEGKHYHLCPRHRAIHKEHNA